MLIYVELYLKAMRALRTKIVPADAVKTGPDPKAKAGRNMGLGKRRPSPRRDIASAQSERTNPLSGRKQIDSNCGLYRRGFAPAEQPRTINSNHQLQSPSHLKLISPPPPTHLYIMKFSVAAVLSFAVSTYAWAQAGDGTWVANNVVYNIRGSQVHESCTRRNTNDILVAVPCAYWIDGRGNIAHGTCTSNFNQVACI
ncbi:hypothetical protein CSOJ01_11892 [Colletotrichum sojae]|uniref:Uncharacterized protein n=1 Tax=Colletotrichum sojae TaxID=2175907 RepID=A0A8H6MN22_9PEZI|nr:hypothetical protein CSOJ01_11892 [Colletotrichum sojae]